MAGDSKYRPKIVCQILTPSACDLDLKPNDDNVNATTMVFNNVVINGCKLCFTNASAVLNESKLVDSSITMHSGQYTEMLTHHSVLRQTRVGLKNYCNKTRASLRNQSCPDTSLMIFMWNTSFTGQLSELSLKNISNFDLVLHNVTLANFKNEIYLSAAKELKLQATNVTLRHFKSTGAGITIDSSHANVTASFITSEFLHNKCTLGAALSVRTSAKLRLDLVVTDSKFLNNSGSSAGSAIKLDLGEHRTEEDQSSEGKPMLQKAAIMNSTFANNLNDESAAAVFIAGGRVTIMNSQFHNNSAKAKLSIPSKSADRKGAGGAIYGMEFASIIIDQCLFVNNSANWFGGAVAGSAAFTLANSKFQNSRTAMHSNLGEIFYLSGPVMVANLSFNIIHAQYNVPLIWYASNDDSVLQGIGEGFFEFNCPQGSQFRNDSLPELEIVDAFKDLFYFCDPCPDNSYSLDHGFRSGPLSDGLGDWSSNFTCIPCSYGAVCKHGRIQARYNFWGFTSHNNTQVEMLTCPDGFCCPHDTCETYNVCAANRTGTLCGECEEGMSESLFTVSCVPNDQCKDSWYFVLDIVSSLIIMLFFLYQYEIIAITCKYLFWIDVTTDDDPTFAGYVKSVFYFYQTIDLLRVQKNQAEEIVGVAIQPMLTYLLSFRSIAIIFGTCPFPGLNPVTKTILQSAPTMYSFAFLGILTLVYMLYKCTKKEDTSTYVEFRRQSPTGPGKVSFGSRIALAGISYFLYNYISISNMTFELLACVPIGDRNVLYFDGNVQCIQPWQGFFILIAILQVCPFFMAVIVSRELLVRNFIGTTQLFLSYFQPLPMIIYWVFMYMTKWRHMKGMKVEDATRGSTQLEPEQSMSEEELAKVQILAVIEEPYVKRNNAASHCYWEGILIFRRLILTCIAAFAIDPLLGISLQSLMCFIFLLWHIYAEPFGSKQANVFETVSLSILTIVGACHMIQATLLSIGESAIGPNKTQIFVTDWIEWVLVNIFPLLLGLALAIFIVVRLFMCCGTACKSVYNKCRARHTAYATLF